MGTTKLAAGAMFPKLEVDRLGGGKLELDSVEVQGNWRMVVVYRGKHCPICTGYLTQLNDLLPKFKGLGVEAVAVSADTQAQATAQLADLNLGFPVGYGLSVSQMQQLGLYISDPRSEEETDHPFPEPGLFVMNENGAIQITDLSNAPFARPDLNVIVGGIGFVKDPENNYPIRGMHD